MSHSGQTHVPIPSPYAELCFDICVPLPPDTKHKLWVMGDASFAPTGEKSQLGLIVYHGITSVQQAGGNLAQWLSSRQDLIAKSTCEAELIASSEPLQQRENIATVVAEVTNQSCEVEVSSDYTASLHMILTGSETAWRTRHISVKALRMHHWPREGLSHLHAHHRNAADSLANGLRACRLPRIRDDLKLIEDKYAWIKLTVINLYAKP